MKQTGEKSVWYKSVKEAGKRFVKPNGGHIVRFPFFVRHKLALTELTFTGVAPINRTFFWNVPRKKCRSIDNPTILMRKKTFELSLFNRFYNFILIKLICLKKLWNSCKIGRVCQEFLGVASRVLFTVNSDLVKISRFVFSFDFIFTSAGFSFNK